MGDPLHSQAKANRRSLNEAEAMLWSQLKGRALEVKFRRQYVVLGYIVDFACISHHLIVELDGSQHTDSVRDQIRDRNLSTAGWKVVRFWSWEVFEENEMVIDTISRELDLTDS